MITQQEFNELFKDFVGSYNRKPTLFLELAWYEVLKDKSERELVLLFKDIIQRYKFLPSIAEVLEENKQKNILFAWIRIVKASGRIESEYSLNHRKSKQKIIAQLPEIAQAFLKETGKDLYQIGFLNTEKELPIVQREFEKFAKNYKPKNNNQKQLGEGK